MHIQPRTKDSASSRKFPYVLFSAPPSGSPDYPAEVLSLRMLCAPFTCSSILMQYTSDFGLVAKAYTMLITSAWECCYKHSTMLTSLTFPGTYTLDPAANTISTSLFITDFGLLFQSVACCRLASHKQHIYRALVAGMTPFAQASASEPQETQLCLQVREAAKLWDGTGSLVFTSSAGLFEVDDGSHCNEDCKIADRGSSERTDK